MVAPYEMNEEPKENAPPKKAAAEGQSPSIEEIMADPQEPRIKNNG